MKFPHFPAWCYGPDGQAHIASSAADVPSGWEDHPSKVTNGAAPSDGGNGTSSIVVAVNPGGAPLPATEFPNAGGSPIGTAIGDGASTDLRGTIHGLDGQGNGPNHSVDLAKEAAASGAGGAGEAAGLKPEDLDAHGWPWDPNLHAATKTKTNAGLWRMNVGKSRPDAKEGYPKPVLDL